MQWDYDNELIRRARLQYLSDTARVSKLRLAGHILRLLEGRPANVAATNWTPDNGIKTGRTTEDLPHDIYRGSTRDWHKLE